MKVKDVNLNEIKKIVDKHNDTEDIFYKRYYKGGKQHLHMKFWENHFEWNEVKSHFPEIDGHVIDFGCVWSSHTFEHIEDPSGIFKDLNTLTKPGAKMLISVPFADCYPHPTHVHYWYSEKEFEDFLGQFVTVDKVIKRRPVLRAVVVLDK